ncbi:uncharacterized protein EI90DRAFT_3146049 [Cantharellus anzutake]|uniref:uncharacterized protein n=1 Tax=Cantharellus anzutake TaxID=1750568 RepID=UPI00190698EC|nr:uncharacterized protein EI90DRAFT_3146049 [Cantharellus anzutake]KAF8329159.1 hypothetical protein EI90DRAFT_3146049 [Cantharellus anzutake]
MGTVVIQAVVVLTMVGITFGLVESHVSTTSNANLRTLPCYFALFILAQLFHLVLTFDALRLRNIIQVIGLLLFQGAITIFAGIQIEQTHTALVTNPGANCQQYYVTCSGPGSLWSVLAPFQVVTPVISGVSFIILCYFAWKLYHEFGWAVFRMVGADPQLKNMFRYYQIMIVLLKFDYFAFIGVTMQLLILVVTHNSAQFVLTIIALPVVFVLLLACGVAVTKEIKWLMLISMALMLTSEAYFIYKFTRLFEPQTKGEYVTTRKTLGVFLGAAFLLLLSTFCVSIKCFRDFNKGLKSGKIRDNIDPMEGGEPLRERISIE